MLGSLNPISQTIFTSNSSLWLGITVGGDTEMTPRVQVGSVPYAFQSLSAVSGGVPAGTIVMWSGSIANIPNGWALCDGTNGTPDLRDRFVVGAGNSYSVGETGGAISVTLTIDQMPSHSHSGTTSTWNGMEFSQTSSHGGGDVYYGMGTIQYSNNILKGAQSHTVNVGAAGGDQPHENRPPYLSLAYIMKLP